MLTYVKSLLVFLSCNLLIQFSSLAQEEHIVLTTYDDTQVTARKSITLKPGFQVTAGQTFHGRVGNQYFDHQLNWTRSTVYSVDEQGNTITIGDSKAYFDGTGKMLQSQSKTFTNNEIFASQPVYDELGNPVLSTLSAPLRTNAFGYEPKFITNTSGDAYGPNDFDLPNSTGAAGEVDNPKAVGDAEPGTLGWYYSTRNNIEPQTPVTDYPYSRSWSEKGPDPRYGKAAGPGEAHKMGSGHEVESRKMVAAAGELDHYYSLRSHFTSTSTPLEQGRAYKLRSIDPNGKYSFTYVDAEGKALVSLFRGELTTIPVEDQSSFNIPEEAGTSTLTIVVDQLYSGPEPQRIYVNNLDDSNLSQQIDVVSTGKYYVDVVPGNYAVFGGTLSTIPGFTAEEYSYSYYNDVGQLVATVAPKGVNKASTSYPQFVTTYEYDHRGLLIATMNADEGTTRYKYSTDGKIRFSQNSKQLAQGTNYFSYTDYDHLGRLLESGQYKGPVTFDNTDTYLDNIGHNTWSTSYKEDVTKIFYDLPAADLPADTYHQGQTFLYGQVSSTENANTKTWYSYNEFGSLEWMVQRINGLGTKTVDYTYDFTGNILEVAYQKGQPDAFYHHYEYDRDQRLTKVYTSKDGSTKTLQAAYKYYYHGPLKRVELGQDLQGIDYVYTINGALKGINNADGNLDPGKDGISGSYAGFDKDVFGMTMHYYNNDYQGAGYSAGAQSMSSANYPYQYGGALRAASWHNATDNNTQARTYAYQYDPKYQLKKAVWGDMTGSGGSYGFTANAAHRVEIDDYDANGNILGLDRKDDNGDVLADYNYVYATNKNQLIRVEHLGATLASFTYNELGQLKTKTEGGITYYFEYDAYGNQTLVRQGSSSGKKVVKYDYDDRGFRVRRIAYDGSGNEMAYTWYVRDAAGSELGVYYEEVGQTPVLTEVPVYGGSRLAIYKPQQQITFYEVGDHLGNVRAVIGQPETQTFTATMEDNHAVQESVDFYPSYQEAFEEPTVANTAVHNHTPETDASKSIRLSGKQGQIVGLAKSLKVSPGDIIDMEVWAKPIEITSSTASDVAAFLGAGFATAFGIGATGETAEAYNFFSDFFSAGSLFTDANGTSTPNGYLNYLLFDENFMLQDLGYAPVNTCSGSGCVYQKLSRQVVVEKAGYIYIYVSNESEKLSEVYFDDLVITHQQSPVVFGHDYYPFGLPMVGRQITDEQYRFDYQGQYAEKDSVTGFNSFALRQYDARFGRWMSTDPYGQFASPYVGMGNNPVNSIDPDGGFSGCPNCFGQALNVLPSSLIGPTSSIINGTILLTDLVFTSSAGRNAFRSMVTYGGRAMAQAAVNRISGGLSVEYGVVYPNIGPFDDIRFNPGSVEGKGYVELKPYSGSSTKVSRVNSPSPQDLAGNNWTDWAGAALDTSDDIMKGVKNNFVNLRAQAKSLNMSYNYTKELSMTSNSLRTIKWGGRFLAAYQARSIYGDYEAGRINEVQLVLEQATNGFSTFGGVYGAAWGVGWEIGRGITHIPAYQRFKNETFLPWRHTHLGY